MTSASRPQACHFAHHLSTAFSDTPKIAATSSRARPASSADSAPIRRASHADGDRCRASPTRSLTPVQRPRTQPVSDQYHLTVGGLLNRPMTHKLSDLARLRRDSLRGCAPVHPKK